MENIQGIDLIGRKRHLNERWLLLGDSQGFGSPLLLQPLAFSPLPLLLSGHSQHLNLDLPILQAETSPNDPLEGL